MHNTDRKYLCRQPVTRRSFARTFSATQQSTSPITSRPRCKAISVSGSEHTWRTVQPLWYLPETLSFNLSCWRMLWPWRNRDKARQRWNSWLLLAHHLLLAIDTLPISVHPLRRSPACGIGTNCFLSMTLAITHWTVLNLSSRSKKKFKLLLLPTLRKEALQNF